MRISVIKEWSTRLEARRYRLSTLLRWGWWVPACSRGTLNKSSTRPVRAITSPGVDGVVHQALDGAHGLGGQGLLGADGVVHDDAVHAGVEKTRDHRGGDHEQDRVGDDQLVLQFEIVSIMMQQPCKWVLHESIFSLYSDGDRPTIFRKVLL